jgi:hypothetical protein
VLLINPLASFQILLKIRGHIHNSWPTTSANHTGGKLTANQRLTFLTLAANLARVLTTTVVTAFPRLTLIAVTSTGVNNACGKFAAGVWNALGRFAASTKYIYIDSEWFPLYRGRKCSFRGIPSSAEEPIPKLGTERNGTEFREKMKITELAQLLWSL